MVCYLQNYFQRNYIYFTKLLVPDYFRIISGYLQSHSPFSPLSPSSSSCSTLSAAVVDLFNMLVGCNKRCHGTQKVNREDSETQNGIRFKKNVLQTNQKRHACDLESKLWNTGACYFLRHSHECWSGTVHLQDLKEVLPSLWSASPSSHFLGRLDQSYPRAFSTEAGAVSSTIWWRPEWTKKWKKQGCVFEQNTIGCRKWCQNV